MLKVRYTRCLIILDLLQFDFFRTELNNSNFVQYLKNIIDNTWMQESN